MGSAPSPLAYTETTSNIKYELPAWLEASNRWRVAQQDKYIKQQQAVAEGLRSGNKAATYKFLGLPNDATPEQYARAVDRFKGHMPYRAPETAAQTAAQGGIMQVRGFAEGGSLTSDEVTFVQKMATLMEGGGTPTTAQQDRLNAIEKRTGKNVSPFTDVGTKAPGNKAVVKAAESMQKSYTANTVNPIASESEKYAQPIGVGKIFVDQNGNQVPEKLADGSPNPAIAGTAIGYTDPSMKAGNQAFLDAMNTTPAQFQQGTDMLSGAYSGLMGAANYTPSNVSAQNAAAGTSSAGVSSAQQAAAAQMGSVADVTSPELQYFQADRGGIRDVAAGKAEAYGYKPEKAAAQEYAASAMGAPEGIAALGYEAALQNAAQQMQGPGTWTDEGVAAKYMNPYIQNVLDIEKREANREYQKQLNELNKQAVAAKAFGGGRFALQLAEAASNQAQLLSDIEAKGLSQAYQQGMGQFTNEQGQSLQAGQANLAAAQNFANANQQALNAQRSQFVTQALEAAKNNYGGQLTAEQQNQIAQNAAAQFNANANMQTSQYNANAANMAAQYYATAQNQAEKDYYAQQFAAAQLNQGMDAQTVMANLQAKLGVQSQAAQQQLQAALANQQTQFGIGSLNANLANQTALQNAQLGTQASMTNAQLATQSSMANAANKTQVSLGNAANALQAGIANQGAGLTANQQGISALSNAGNLGTGMISGGTQYGNYLLNKANTGIAGGTAIYNLGDELATKEAARNAAILTPPTPNPSSNTPGGTNTGTNTGAGTV